MLTYHLQFFNEDFQRRIIDIVVVNGKTFAENDLQTPNIKSINRQGRFPNGRVRINK